MVNGAYMRGLYYLATSATWGTDPRGENAISDPSSIAFLLVSSNAAFQFDGTHNHVSSVSGWELSSTSYQANGDTGHLGRLQAEAISALESDGANVSGVYLTVSSMEWVNMTDSDIIGAVVTFVSAAPDSPTYSNELLFWHGNNFPQTPNGTLTLNPNATSGIAYLQNVVTP